MVILRGPKMTEKSKFNQNLVNFFFVIFGPLNNPNFFLNIFWKITWCFKDFGTKIWKIGLFMEAEFLPDFQNFDTKIFRKVSTF